MYNLDEVIKLLADHKQRATYGAVAKLPGIGKLPRNLMTGRPMNAENSWIVAKTTKSNSGSQEGFPTSYNHTECAKRFEGCAEPIDSPEKLIHWLKNNS